MKLILLNSIVYTVWALITPLKNRNCVTLKAITDSPSIDNKSWQEDVDAVLNIDTSCEARRNLLADLFKKSNTIVDDIKTAVEEKDIKKLVPTDLAYGKAFQGLQAFRKQLISDLIPDILFNEGPKLITDSPKKINEIINEGPDRVNKLISRSEEIFTTLKDISQDPSLIQSTIDDVRREAKNVFRSTPEGLQTPDYTVKKKSESYEIREYSTYSVCSTKLDSTGDMSVMSPINTGNGFNKLADYIFGNNNKDTSSEKLTMTTPVIIGDGDMQFVLPSGKSSLNAPMPSIDDIKIIDIPMQIVAAREFPGLATDGEVMRQRAKLEDSLIADGLSYDNLSFRVFQYNPPYTLPWLRRNEVILSINDPSLFKDPVEDTFVSNDASMFYSSPEAGD